MGAARARAASALFRAWDRRTSEHQFGSATLDETPLFVAMKTRPVLFTEAQLRGHVRRDCRPGE